MFKLFVKLLTRYTGTWIGTPPPPASAKKPSMHVAK